jgi:N-acetylmuramoyl-L-alanine amidase
MKRFTRKAFKILVAAALFCMATTAFAQAPDGFISARNFAETQGIAYQWFPIQKMLVMRKGLKTLKVKVDERTALVDDSEITLPAAPIIQDGQIMVPAKAVVDIFQTGNLTSLLNSTKQTENPKTNLNTPPPPIKPPPVQNETIQPTVTSNSLNSSDQAVLVALRHSVREDHTRVVLEFNNNVTYSGTLKDNVYRLVINGCRNLIPTRRTNPVGRDIAKLDINSGPDRKGLILSFRVKQTKKIPTIETVANPFRMIVSFFQPGVEEVTQEQKQVKEQKPNSEPETEIKPEVPKETIPEISINIELTELKNEGFHGRTVIIDPGHGGSDKGYIHPGRKLEKIKLKAVLLRENDEDLTHSQRVNIANKNGADLLISLHTGATTDSDKVGPACVVYSKSGTEISDEDSGISYQAVYNEWAKSTRFDLATFMAKKIDEQFKTHLEIETRGVKQLPLAPLKFITTPAVLVEAGMLSNQTEGRKLQSPGYHEAIATCIANGVANFFNGIVINP